MTRDGEGRKKGLHWEKKHSLSAYCMGKVQTKDETLLFSSKGQT